MIIWSIPLVRAMESKVAAVHLIRSTSKSLDGVHYPQRLLAAGVVGVREEDRNDPQAGHGNSGRAHEHDVCLEGDLYASRVILAVLRAIFLSPGSEH